MIHEILNTSAPSGLKPGSSGYCTVKSSRGIPGPTMDLLESLSGYRHVFTPGSVEASRNPVNWGHYLVRIGGRMVHVLSRVSDCPLDYTGRSNKLAHHMVLDGVTAPAGPAWLLGRPGWMIDKWDGRVEQFAATRVPPQQARQGGRCAEWERVTGSQEGAGWAGVMAESFLADPDRKVFLIYPPGVNALALFEEALALVPENRRWDVTFATYGASLPKTVDFLWSGIVAGSTEVQQSMRFVNALRIDLTALTPPPPGGPLVQTARTGVVAKRPTAPPLVDRNRSGISLPHPPWPPSTGAPRPAAVDRMNYAAQDAADEPLPPSLPLNRRTRSDFPWALVGGVVAGALALSVGVAVFLFSDKPDQALAMNNAEIANPPAAPAPSPPKNAAPIAPPQTGNGSAGQGNGAPSSTQDPTPSQKGSDLQLAQGSDDKMDLPGSNQNPAPSTPPTSTPNLPPLGANPDMPPEKAVPVEPKPTVPKPPEPNPPMPPQEDKPKADMPTTTTLAATKKPWLKPKQPVELSFSSEGKLLFQDVTYARLMVPIPREKASGRMATASQAFESGACVIANEKSLGLKDSLLSIGIKTSGEGAKVTWQNPEDKFDDVERFCLEHGMMWLQDEKRRATLQLQFAPAPEMTSHVTTRKTNVTWDVSKLEDDFVGVKSLLRVIDIGSLRFIDLKVQYGGETLTSTADENGNTRWNLSERTKGVVNEMRLGNQSQMLQEQSLSVRFDFTPDLKSFDDSKEKSELREKYEALANKGYEKVPNADKVSLDTDLNTHRDRLLQQVQKKLVAKTLAEKDSAAARKEIEEYISDLDKWFGRMRVVESLGKDLRVTAGTVQYKVRAIKLADPTKAVPDAPQELYVDLFKFREGK